MAERCFFWHVLHHQTVGLETFEVALRHLRQGSSDPGHCRILRPHDEIVHRAVAAVGKQLGDEDVVPVHAARGIREGLAPAAALPIHLVIGSSHGVDEVQVAGEEPHQRVDGELGPCAPPLPARPLPSSAAPAPTSAGPRAPWPPGSSESGATAPARSPAFPHKRAWSTIPCPHRAAGPEALRPSKGRST